MITRDDPFTSQVDEAIDVENPPIMDLNGSQFTFGLNAYTELFEDVDGEIKVKVQSIDLSVLFDVGAFQHKF